jgi:hypothetical protein
MSLRLSLAAAVLVAALAACGGGGGGSPASPLPPSTPPSITLSATASQTLSGGKPVALTATLASSEPVTWQLAAGAPGSLSAASGGTVNYLPPASVAAMTTVTVTASAGGASKAISLTLYPEPGAPGLRHVAGTLGGIGNADDAGALARFGNITDTATDGQGNLYVVDRSAIRKVSAAGQVTTLAVRTDSHADGPAGQGHIGYPQAIAAGANGAVLFLDNAEGKVSLRQLAPDGSVTTLVQDALLEKAWRMVAAPANKAYLIRNRSIVLAGAGTATVLAGDDSDSNSPPADGQGNTARFADIGATTADSDGNLLVVHGNRLSKVTPAGVVSTVLSMSGATSSNEESIGGLALDSGGNPVVLVHNQKSRYYALRRLVAGKAESLFQDWYASVEAMHDPTAPLQLRVAGGKILLVRRTDIRQLQENLLQPFAGLANDYFSDVDGPGTAARFANLEWLAADRAGNIYVTDFPPSFQTNRLERQSGLYLRKIAPDNTVSTVLIRTAFGVPSKMVADTAGNLYISEQMTQQSRIQPRGGAVYKVTPDGTLSLLAGQPAALGPSDQQADGIGATARFIMPVLAGVDAAGNVYVREQWGTTDNVRKIAPDGTVTTMAALPAGLGAAPDGYTYTAERGAIYRHTAAGKEVVAGIPGSYGNAPGALPGRLEERLSLTPTGLHSFALISGNAILKLVLPH